MGACVVLYLNLDEAAPIMKGRTICVILQNHDEAPINEGSDNLRHFKSRVFREKNILYDYA